MKKLMGDEGGGPCFSLLTPSVCVLTHKLHHYGIRGEVNTWTKNWLKDRTLSVVVEGEKSEPVSVDSGVPQGSDLGAGLFLYYINDLPEWLRSRVRPFADDTIAYLVIILPKDTEALQEDLEDLATWENKWHIEFQANKCVVLTVSGKKAPVHADYKLHDQTLTRVPVIHLQFWAYGSWDSLFPISMSPNCKLMSPKHYF